MTPVAVVLLLLQVSGGPGAEASLMVEEPDHVREVGLRIVTPAEGAVAGVRVVLEVPREYAIAVEPVSVMPEPDGAIVELWKTRTERGDLLVSLTAIYQQPVELPGYLGRCPASC